eukprot:1317475-Amphidinium_carterae.1
MKGFPLSASGITVEDVLIEMDWDATILDDSRKVFCRHASFKVRAPEPPPADTVQFAMDGVTYQ